jgi:hypothetical protein
LGSTLVYSPSVRPQRRQKHDLSPSSSHPPLDREAINAYTARENVDEEGDVVKRGQVERVEFFQ